MSFKIFDVETTMLFSLHLGTEVLESCHHAYSDSD